MPQSRQSFADRFPFYMSPEGIAATLKAAQQQRARQKRTKETRAVIRAIEASLAAIEPDAELEPFAGVAR